LNFSHFASERICILPDEDASHAPKLKLPCHLSHNQLGIFLCSFVRLLLVSIFLVTAVFLLGCQSIAASKNFSGIIWSFLALRPGRAAGYERNLEL